MIGGATNTTNQIAQGKLTFGNQLWVNLQGLFSAYDIPLIMRNSLEISGITVILLFMMIQLAALVIPLFRIMAGLQLVNEHLAIILPAINNLFLIFFFRQSFKSFPNEIIDASKIEGAGNYAIFFRIVFPMMKSTYAAAAIYAFMNSWNSYLLPLIFLQTEDKYTMTTDFQPVFRFLYSQLRPANGCHRHRHHTNTDFILVYAKRVCKRNDRVAENVIFSAEVTV